MTDVELDEYRLKLKVTILEMALSHSLTYLGQFSSEGLTSYKQKLSLSRSSYHQLLLKSSDPAMSDLVNSEFQEAFDSVMSFIDSETK